MSNCTAEMFSLTEKLLLHEFKTVPFHNLFYLGLCTPSVVLKGGTCSDKVLAFQKTLAQHAIESRLHTSLMPDWANPEADLQDSHRLLVMELGGERYFADVGNGWPSVRLFSFERAVHYRVFGIEYYSEITSESVDVYHLKEGKRTLSQRVPKQLTSEAAVRDAVDRRFSTGKKYPFSTGLRFAQVIGDEFRFLKKDQLQIYSQSGRVERIALPSRADQIHALDRWFGLDIKALGLAGSQFGSEE